MTLAEKIAALRGERKLSQGDLAEKLDVSRQSVSKWETGQAVPELDKIVKLADVFGVTVDELVRDGEAPKAEAPQPETLPAGPEPKIIYVERKGLSPVQTVGIAALVMGALMLFLGWLSVYVPLIGVVLVILSLPLILAKKHPFLIAGWLLCLGSCAVFNPYTSISPWGLRGGVHYLFFYLTNPELRYATNLFAAAIGITRGVLALALIFFTVRACLRRWKERSQRQEETGGQPES